MKTKIILFSLLLTHAFTNFTPVSAENSLRQKAGKAMLKTLKVGSHLIELATGLMLIGVGVACLPEEQWLEFGMWDNLKEGDVDAYAFYGVGSIITTAFILNGLRGLKKEFNIGRKKTFVEKLKLVIHD